MVKTTENRSPRRTKLARIFRGIASISVRQSIWYDQFLAPSANEKLKLDTEFIDFCEELRFEIGSNGNLVRRVVFGHIPSEKQIGHSDETENVVIVLQDKLTLPFIL